MVASLEDFVIFTAYTDLSDEEEAQITLWLLQVEQMILDYTGNIWDNTNGSSLVSDGVQIGVVRRYFDNQRGVTSVSADGVSTSLDERAYEGLRLTYEDKKNLGRLTARKGVSTARMNRNRGFVW